MPRGILRAAADLTCAICSGTFRPNMTGQKYCSPRCKNLGGARLRMARNAARDERPCYGCGEIRPTSAFTSLTKPYCAACDVVYQREHRRKNPDKNAVYKRRSIAKAAAADPDYYRKLTLRKFGLTLEAFDRLVQRYDGRCGICRTAEPGGRHDTWHVDHDHRCCPKSKSCGRCIRGILCSNCNVGLGYFKDSADTLRAAIVYLASHS